MQINHLEFLEAFQGVELEALSNDEQEIIMQASKDFEMVCKVHKPYYAVFDEEAPLPSDGGTTYYKAKGYKLTVLKKLTCLGKGELVVHGFLYGAVITFDAGFIAKNSFQISNIKFYTANELNKLIDKAISNEIK